MRGDRFISLPASLADVPLRLAAFPCPHTVNAMPFATGFRSMPFRSEGPGSIGSEPTAFPLVIRDRRAVLPKVVDRRHALQIVDRVVERIAVAVVDVMTSRDRPVHSLPNLLVEPTNAPLPVVRSRDEVHSIRPSLRVGVASKRDAIELDGL